MEGKKELLAKIQKPRSQPWTLVSLLNNWPIDNDATPVGALSNFSTEPDYWLYLLWFIQCIVLFTLVYCRFTCLALLQDLSQLTFAASRYMCWIFSCRPTQKSLCFWDPIGSGPVHFPRPVLVDLRPERAELRGRSMSSLFLTKRRSSHPLGLKSKAKWCSIFTL